MIAIGTQLFEIYDDLFVISFALTDFSFFVFGVKCFRTSSTIDCWIEPLPMVWEKVKIQKNSNVKLKMTFVHNTCLKKFQFIMQGTNWKNLMHESNPSIMQIQLHTWTPIFIVCW